MKKIEDEPARYIKFSSRHQNNNFEPFIEKPWEEAMVSIAKTLSPILAITNKISSNKPEGKYKKFSVRS